MGRKPTSRATVLAVISELSPLSCDDGKALQRIIGALEPYGITASAARQQVDASRKLGYIELLSERGRIFEVEITPKGLKFLEENSAYIKSPALPIVEEPVTSAEITKLDSLDDFFIASRQAEAMLSEERKQSGERELKLEARLNQALEELEKLRSENAELTAKHLKMSEELKTVRRKLKVREDRELGTLQPRQLPKVWRDTAQIAVEQGWRITLSGGDHIKWISPRGLALTSAQTPSDHRTVRNFRAQLARNGLQVR